jgi:hypothetical protein
MKRSMSVKRWSIALATAACVTALWLAPAAGAAPVRGGTVTLLTDPGQSKAMYLGGIAPFFVPPAALRLTDDAWRFTLPLAGGTLASGSGAGAVSANGGIMFWGRETMSAWLELQFTKLHVNTGAQAALGAVYGMSGTRHVLATLAMSGASVTTSTSGGHQWITVAHAPAKMSPWLRTHLTQAFPRFVPSGSRLGTVSIKARLN